MNLRDLFLRLRALVARQRVERELDEELAFHIERETEKHIAAGLSSVDARARALARFGPVPLAADQCRDARGTSFVDDLARDIRYALRTFRRAPLAAVTIIATVALGLGLVAVVFTVYNILFLSADAVQRPGELFAVELEQRIAPDNEPDVVVTRSDYDALRRETSVFSDAFAMLDLTLTRIEGRPAVAVLVTGNFFQVLGVQAALGRPLLPEDDERFAGRPVIVLSHAGWRKLFRGDQGVIGRRVVINGAPYEIVGVMPDGFRGLGITPPDYWAPLALAGQFRDTTEGPENGMEVVGRLKQGLSPEAATAALAAWASGRTDFKTVPGHPIQVSLTPRRGTLSADDMDSLLLFAPLFFAFGLILAIGCANVANLLLARGISRQREIGIRLSLGASRRRIIRQLLTESLLLALAAAACGLVVSRLFLEGTLYAVITTLPPEIAQFANVFNLAAAGPDWRVLVFLVAGAIVSTVFFGLAPALQATRLDLVPTMRGEVVRDARPRRARHALIAAQVGASALLLICAAIFLRGAVAAATKDPGVRTSDTLRISFENSPRRAALLEAISAHPLVAVVAASSPTTRGVVEPLDFARGRPLDFARGRPLDFARGRTSAPPGRVSVEQFAVSSDYFNVLGVEVVSGRNFTRAERTADAGVAIVSETVARQLWPNGDGVGQEVRLAPPSRTLTVVGVVRNPGRDSGSVYVPTSPETPETALFLRVRGNPEQARQVLLERLSSIDPALMNVMTLRALTGMHAYALQVAFWVAVVLGGLALVLTVSGLFSVLSYVVEQRAKEIGVRMALGATTRHVAQLVVSQSLRPVGIGLAAGGGLAAAVAIVLMATPIAAEIGDSVDVFDPAAYAASALVIATACLIAVSVPTLRAARIDPIATLRKD